MESLYDQNNLKRTFPDYNKFYFEYKEEFKRKPKTYKVTVKADYIRIVKACLKKIGFLWTNSTGGVYVRGLGYLSLIRPTRKFTKEGNIEYLKNFHRTDGYSYLLLHQDKLRNSDSFGGFRVKIALGKVKMSAYNNIINGRRYTINSILIKEFLKKRTFL